MAQALRLAAATAALASPNPQVGCVLTRNGQVLGEGAHLYATRDHAEIVALRQAAALGHSVRGATAYVTLEPCAHHGRTGPCAEALVAAGIARAVVATVDPNPLVSGQGLAKLRNAGIDVTLGTLEQPARTLNNAFAHFIQHRRPFVTLKAALSADGMLAPNPANRIPGQPHWLTGPLARSEVQRLRHASDAILTGIGTVLADDPALTDRTGLSRRRPLLRVVLDTHLRTPPTAHLLHPANSVLVLHGPNAAPERITALERAGAELHRLPEHNGRLSLPALLHLLAARDCTSLLLEAGSRLNAAFLEASLVDDLALFQALQTLGPKAIPFAEGLPIPTLQNPTRQTLGPDTLTTSLLHDPWPPPATPA